jgi:WXG100 family type VII secretion target
MAGGQIRVTPGDLRACAGQCRAYGEEQEGLINKTQTLIDNLRNQWEGASASAYADQFARLRPSYDRIRELYVDLSKQLDDTAAILEDTDQQIANKLSG